MTYDRSYIVDSFRGLIGFMPSYDNSNAAAKVDDTLKLSVSGQYINNLHNYFTAEIFSSVSGNFKEYTVIAWSSSAAYKKDDVVMYNSAYYRSIQDGTNQSPSTETAYWRKTTLLSVWIQDKYDGAVLATVDALMEANKLSGHGKELRAVTGLYNAEGVKTNLITKSSRFVGYEINISESNMAVTLQRIGMQLNGQKAVPIHIIYNGEDTIVTPTFSGNSRFNYQDIEPITFRSGMGPVTVGYYEDDLDTVSAIGMVSSTFAQAPCYTCGGSENGNRSTWGKYITVSPIASIDGDIDSYDTNYGLNLAMSFRCDLSDILIREKMSVVPALKAMLRVMFMEAIAANVRNNKEADVTQTLVYNQLQNYQDPFGPKNQLKNAIKALQFEMSNINPACLPCASRIKIRNNVI